MTCWTNAIKDLKHLQQWNSDKPINTYNGLEKIRDKKYEDLILSLFKNTDNSLSFKTGLYINLFLTTTFTFFVYLTTGYVVIAYLYIIYFIMIIHREINSNIDLSLCFENDYINYFVPPFIRVNKTKRNVFHFSENMMENFKDEIKNKDSTKLCLFNYITGNPDYIKHKKEKYASWDIGGITNVNAQDICNFNFIYSIQITDLNIKEQVEKIATKLGYYDDYSKWGMEKFIQSILDGYKTLPKDGIKIYYSEYDSPDDCYIIKNSRIPDIIKDERDLTTLVNVINSFPEYKSNFICTNDLYEKRYYFHRKFFDEYTIVGNGSWCNSNINKRNTRYELTLANDSLTYL